MEVLLIIAIGLLVIYVLTLLVKFVWQIPSMFLNIICSPFNYLINKSYERMFERTKAIKQKYYREWKDKDPTEFFLSLTDSEICTIERYFHVREVAYWKPIILKYEKFKIDQQEERLKILEEEAAHKRAEEERKKIEQEELLIQQEAEKERKRIEHEDLLIQQKIDRENELREKEKRIEKEKRARKLEEKRLEEERIGLVTRKKDLLNMGSYEFEIFVSKIFEKMGYVAKVTPRTNDEGKDIILKKNGQVFFVECKNHHGPVGREVLQKLYGEGARHKVNKCICISTGGFRDTAKNWAKEVDDLDLYDSKILLKLIDRFFENVSNNAKPIKTETNTKSRKKRRKENGASMITAVYPDEPVSRDFRDWMPPPMRGSKGDGGGCSGCTYYGMASSNCSVCSRFR